MAADLEQVLACLHDGRAAEAEAILRASIAAGSPAPGFAGLLARVVYNRGVESFRRDGVDAAEPLLREALALAPELDVARRGLAELLFRRCLADEAGRNWVKVTATVLEAAALAPDLGVTLGAPAAAMAERLGPVAGSLSSGDPILAARVALAAWLLAPAGSGNYATARSMFVHLGTGELGPAIADSEFEALLTRGPRDLVARLGLANRQRRAGKTAEAEALCRDALKYAPDNPFALGRLASILVDQARYREADRICQALGARYGGIEAVIRLSPDFVATLPPIDAPRWIDPPPDSVPHFDAAFVVLAGCDAGYFHRFADALANSIAKACPAAALHLHVVQPDAEVPQRLAAIRQRLPGLPILMTSEAVPEGMPPDQRRTYFACARFLRLPDLLRFYAKPVLVLDVDAIVLREVAPLLEQQQLEQADLSAIVSRISDPWARLWADVMLASPSALSIRYFETVRRYILHFLVKGQAVWFLDQIALFAAHVAGFPGEAGPRLIEWPPDLQNSHTSHAYFWSLHMSQPNNAAAPDSDFYRSFRDAGGSGPTAAR